MTMVDYAFRMERCQAESKACGDFCIISPREESILIALIDGLGHGVLAEEIARAAGDCILSNQDEKLHRIICKTDIAAERQPGGRCRALPAVHSGRAVCRSAESEISQSESLERISRVLYSQDGIIGYSIPSPRSVEINLLRGSTIIMTSDGIDLNLESSVYGGLLSGSADFIAEKIISLRKPFDDASCIVLRYMQ